MLRDISKYTMIIGRNEPYPLNWDNMPSQERHDYFSQHCQIVALMRSGWWKVETARRLAGKRGLRFGLKLIRGYRYADGYYQDIDTQHI